MSTRNYIFLSAFYPPPPPPFFGDRGGGAGGSASWSSFLLLNLAAVHVKRFSPRPIISQNGRERKTACPGRRHQPAADNGSRYSLTRFWRPLARSHGGGLGTSRAPRRQTSRRYIKKVMPGYFEITRAAAGGYIAKEKGGKVINLAASSSISEP